VLADEGGDPVEFRTPETAALVEAHRVEPELCSILVALHVDVRRLGPVTGEEEPVGASPEHGRHAERCYGGRCDGNGRPVGRGGQSRPTVPQAALCRRLTPELHLQGHLIRCGAAGAATMAPLSAATHVRRVVGIIRGHR